METKVELQVTKVRYFETRRGVGYECRTNIPKVTIWNDGDGGATYIRNNSGIQLPRLNEFQLEDLITKFEMTSILNI